MRHVATIALVVLAIAGPLRAADVTATWIAFASKSGWTIKYPPKWQVGSCNSCTDPTAPNVPVSFFDPSSRDLVRIEILQNKPGDQTIEGWLHRVAETAVLNPRISEEWTDLDKRRALTVRTRNPDSTQSENIYVVDQSRTVFIQAPSGQREILFNLQTHALQLQIYTRIVSCGRKQSHRTGTSLRCSAKSSATMLA